MDPAHAVLLQMQLRHGECRRRYAGCGVEPSHSGGSGAHAVQGEVTSSAKLPACGGHSGDGRTVDSARGLEVGWWSRHARNDRHSTVVIIPNDSVSLSRPDRMRTLAGLHLLLGAMVSSGGACAGSATSLGVRSAGRRGTEDRPVRSADRTGGARSAGHDG